MVLKLAYLRLFHFLAAFTVWEDWPCQRSVDINERKAERTFTYANYTYVLEKHGSVILTVTSTDTSALVLILLQVL